LNSKIAMHIGGIGNSIYSQEISVKLEHG
jgi:hypothetical protein